MIGPDMNLEGRRVLATNFEFISLVKKSCTGTIHVKINNERIQKELSCTDDRLNVPPEARNKRSIRNESLLGTRDANGLVYGCEDSVNLGFGDILMHPTDIARKIKKQRQCCTNGGQSRRKRQFFVMEENMNLFWNMPLSYDFSDDEEDWIKIIRKALNDLRSLTCLQFEQARTESWSDLKFINIGRTCSSTVGNRNTNSPHKIYVPWSNCGKVINYQIYLIIFIFARAKTT
uniref:Peptidase M12A domain-containing protein n=1 Tax=Meloidogyne incognita TaxID=6306 RepID=A0A914N0F4_MELIC